ncbi:WG repeat-containing protein [Myroides odoratimimus]|uniref:WG repeat-containing protein n=1 Tax=Myroides odoratimimus TaxID=76832 RepID=UPI002574D20C|nr:WG repeat-containing protein [Myroides odoratimimus]MDM1505250.1 WG repeat-containing protein [Myroides odoratimimus]MDM1515677.1 WG repeat-containing protein [Myroides odoratimimus]
MKKITLLILIGFLSFSCSNDDNNKNDKPKEEKPDYQPKILIPFEERGLWGFRDPQANVVVVVPQYEAVKDFDQHKIARVKKSKLWGIIDMLGKPVIAPTYNDIKDFSIQGYATVVRLEKSGVINTKGEEKIEPLYDEITGYYDKQYVKVMIEQKYGIIDKDWKLAIKPSYTKIRDFGTEGVNVDHIIVEQNTKRGLINKNWKVLANAKYDSITKFDTRGIAMLIDSLKMGMINTEGKILEPKYDEIKESNDEVEVTYKVVLKEKWGLLNKDWKEIIAPRFEADFKIFEFDKSGYARLHVGEKWGFIDKNHKVILEPIYDEITEFDEQGFARIKVGEKWGVINREFKVLLAPEYDNITVFNAEGFARVNKNGKWGVINKQWKVVLPVIYDNIGTLLPYDMTILTLDSKLGLANKNWEVVLPVDYKDINVTEDQGTVRIYNDIPGIERAVGLFHLKTYKRLEPTYERIDNYNSFGYALVQKNEISKNLIDKNFEERLDTYYTEIYPFNEAGVFKVLKAPYLGVFDSRMNMLVEPTKYTDIDEFAEDNHAVVSFGNKSGLINRQWKEVLAVEYDEISTPDKESNRKLTIHTSSVTMYNVFNQNGKTLEDNYKEIKFDYANKVILLKGMNDLHGFASVNLVHIISPVYENELDFTNALVARMKQNGVWGLINKQGIIVINPMYDRISEFNNEGYAYLVKGGLYGFVNHVGLTTVHAKYEIPDYALTKDKLAKVRANGLLTIVNYENGIELFKPGQYTDVDNLFKGYAAYLEKGKWGIVDKLQKVVSVAKYDKVERFTKDNTARIRLNNYVGFMNDKGVIVLEPTTYSHIGEFKDGKTTAIKNGVAVVIDINGKEI